MWRTSGPCAAAEDLVALMAPPPPIFVQSRRILNDRLNGGDGHGRGEDDISVEDDPKETWAGGEQGMFLPFRSGIALGKAEGEIQRADRHECRRKESIIRLEGIHVPGLFLGRHTIFQLLGCFGLLK